MNIGVIGTGVMGRFHARNLASGIEHARLVAVCDTNAAHASDCAAECSVDAVFDDHRMLLASDDVEAVVICTPGGTHGAIIEAAAKAGKHVFCEKPIDSDVAAADAALAAVERSGVTLQIGFNRRFDASFRRAREAVASGAIGRPHLLRIVSRDPLSDDLDALADLFVDTTIHDVDMARFIIGSEVASVYAVAECLDESRPGGPADTAVTVLRFAEGAIATIENSRRSVTGYDQRLELFASNGTIKVANETPDLNHVGEGRGRSPLPMPFFIERYAASYVSELEAFVQCVREGTKPGVTGADGRAALALALAARQSASVNSSSPSSP